MSAAPAAQTQTPATATAIAIEEPQTTEDAATAENPRTTEDPGAIMGHVLTELEKAGHKMLASTLESGSVTLKGNELVVSIAQSAAVIDLMMSAEPKRLANAAASTALGRPADAVWRQAGVPNLIQQRAIADVQGPRSLLAVPVVVVQDFQNNFALQGARRLPGKFLQRDRAVEVDVRAQHVRVARLQVAADAILAAQDHITLDQIFEFADVPRPVILLQNFHQFG